MLRRCRHPGAVDPLLFPFKTIVHVPCSFDCKATAQLALDMADRVGPSRRNLHPRVVHHPFLFLLDRPGQRIELVPQEKVDRRFRFTTGIRVGDDARLQRLSDGDTITIEEGAIQIWRDGRRVQAFFLSAAIFWLEKAFDPEFWIQCALETLEPSTVPGSIGGQAQPAQRTEPAPPRQTVAFSSALMGFLGPPEGGAFNGFVLRSVEPSRGRYVVLILERSEGQETDRLTVHAEPLTEAKKYYQAAGDLALSYASETPLDTALRQGAFDALAVRLAGFQWPKGPG